MLDRPAFPLSPALTRFDLRAARDRIGPVEGNLMQAALFYLILTVPLTLLMLADPRQVGDVSTWLKPWKFTISFVVHLGTIAFLWRWLLPSVRDGWQGRMLVRLLLACCLFEGTYMASQAALGQGSHYNVATLYTMVMFQLMGVVAVVLVLATFLAGVAVLRGSANEGDPILRRAIGLGLMLSGGLGLLTGAFLGANGGHVVGVPADPFNVIPVVGWSREVGDLRVSHFIGLHALQVLPVIGWVVSTTAPKHGLRLVTIAAVTVAILSIATLVQAVTGQPLI